MTERELVLLIVAVVSIFASVIVIPIIKLTAAITELTVEVKQNNCQLDDHEKRIRLMESDNK